MMPCPIASVGIVSIGEMGLGIARMLKSTGYRVMANVSDRRSAVRGGNVFMDA